MMKTVFTRTGSSNDVAIPNVVQSTVKGPSASEDRIHGAKPGLQSNTEMVLEEEASSVGSQTSGSRSFPENLEVLCVLGARGVTQGLRLATENRLRELGNRDYVNRIAVLPDVHWKPRMETPSSIAVESGSYVVPDATSVALNDCMSVIRTQWHKDELEPQWMEVFFRQLNRCAAPHRGAMTPYSPSVEDLASFLFEGATAAVRRYGMPDHWLDSIENQGQSAFHHVSSRDLHRIVPWLMRTCRVFRSEFGLNYRGNHFVEVQYVSDIVDPELAKQWELFPGQVVIMSHLGPGPFTGNLLHLYSKRQKQSSLRRILRAGWKMPWHLGRRSDAKRAERWQAFVNPQRFQGFRLDSAIGNELACAIHFGTNCGFAYQVASHRALLDAMDHSAKERSMSRPEPELLWCVSHNHITRETVTQDPVVIARHNAARAYEGQPTVIAGSYDVPSCLGVGMDGGSRLLRSYDHGFGALIDQSTHASHRSTGFEESLIYYMKRDQHGTLKRIVHRPKRPCKEIVDQALQVLESERITRRVCHMEPLATMHN